MELAEKILERDGARQLDDLLWGVMRGEPSEELVIDVLACESDPVGVGQRQPLGLVEELALDVAVNLQ